MTGTSSTEPYVALEHGFDPITLRPVYESERRRRARVTELRSLFPGFDVRTRRRVAHELDIQLELVELHLAGGSFDEARAVAWAVRQRARLFRSKRQRFVSRLLDADLLVYEGDFVGSTLLLIELVADAEAEPRHARALAHLRMARCEYVQGMYAEALMSSRVALDNGRCARSGEAFRAEALFVLGRAAARMGRTVS